jgi:hypothetical protein
MKRLITSVLQTPVSLNTARPSCFHTHAVFLLRRETEFGTHAERHISRDVPDKGNAVGLRATTLYHSPTGCHLRTVFRLLSGSSSRSATPDMGPRGPVSVFMNVSCRELRNVSLMAMKLECCGCSQGSGPGFTHWYLSKTQIKLDTTLTPRHCILSRAR